MHTLEQKYTHAHTWTKINKQTHTCKHMNKNKAKTHMHTHQQKFKQTHACTHYYQKYKQTHTCTHMYKNISKHTRTKI